MECWNIGFDGMSKVGHSGLPYSSYPIFHFSTVPLFHCPLNGKPKQLRRIQGLALVLRVLELLPDIFNQCPFVYFLGFGVWHCFNKLDSFRQLEHRSAPFS
jgi:hypothetical protein